jgi:hypothetical protein
VLAEVALADGSLRDAVLEPASNRFKHMPSYRSYRPPLFTSLQYLVIVIAALAGMALGAIQQGGQGAFTDVFAGGLAGVLAAVSFFYR